MHFCHILVSEWTETEHDNRTRDIILYVKEELQWTSVASVGGAIEATQSHATSFYYLSITLTLFKRRLGWANLPAKGLRSNGEVRLYRFDE